MCNFKIISFLLSFFSLASLNASLIHDIEIGNSPDVHKFTENITFKTLQSLNYDITKFSVTVKITDSKKTVEDLLNDRFFRNVETPLKKKIIRHLLGMPEFVKAFAFVQKCEAAGVFYRDIWGMLSFEFSKRSNKEMNYWEFFSNLEREIEDTNNKLREKHFDATEKFINAFEPGLYFLSRHFYSNRRDKRIKDINNLLPKQSKLLEKNIKNLYKEMGMKCFL